MKETIAMSFYETPEQRQIRQLRHRLTVLEKTNNRSLSRAARRQIEELRRRQEEETRRILRQLEEQRERNRQQQSQMSETVRNLDAQMKERERLQNQRIHAMQQQHEREVRNMETRFHQQQEGLRSEIRQTRAEMQQGLHQLREETDQKFRIQREETQRSLTQLNEQLQVQIGAVDRKVDSLARQIAEKENGDRELAVYWAQEAARLVQQLRETFREQLFDARRVSILERKIRNAQNDIRGGQYQSAIVDGREAFFSALDMKEDLVAAELEWNYWFQSIKTREGQLMQALSEAQNRVYEIETSDGVITYDNGIDYWTYGQLSVAENQITAFGRELQNLSSMTVPQMQEAFEKLRGLQEQLALVENAAHINVAMSVSRFDAASKIGNILDENYEMIDSDGEYFAREDREEYHAIFQNSVTGDQVAVVITPIPDETGVVTNHIELIVGNADNNPVTRDRMANEVAGKLRNSGVEGCSFPCARRYGDDTLREVSRVGNIAAVETGDESVRATPPVGREGGNGSIPHVRRK